MIGVYEYMIWLHIDGYAYATNFGLDLYKSGFIALDEDLNYIRKKSQVEFLVLTGRAWFMKQLAKTSINAKVMLVDDSGNVYYFVANSKVLMKLACNATQPEPVAMLEKNRGFLVDMVWRNKQIYLWEVSPKERKERLLLYDPQHASKYFTVMGESVYLQNQARCLTTDKNGNLYVTMNNTLLKIDPQAHAIENAVKLDVSLNTCFGICSPDIGTFLFTKYGEDYIYIIKDGVFNKTIGSPQYYHDGPIEHACYDQPTTIHCLSNGCVITPDKIAFRITDFNRNLVASLSHTTRMPSSRLAVDSVDNIYVSKLWELLKLECSWNIERLLWFGHLKEDPRHCYLPLLPKDIIKYVIYIRKGFSDVVQDGVFYTIQ